MPHIRRYRDIKLEGKASGILRAWKMHTALAHVHPAKREMQRDLAKGETTNVNIKYPLAGRLPSRSRRGAQLASEEIDPAGVTYIAII